MKIEILKESGYNEAITGLSLSYGTTFERSEEISKKLYNKDGGHNKFLEMIYVWLDVIAPRYWWQEADTYRISTKQSASTMHTLHKEEFTQNNFQYSIQPEYLNYLNKRRYDLISKKISLEGLKNDLPEGFLQKRIWCISYKTLRNIISQRKNHKLKGWEYFCEYVLSNTKYNYFFDDLK